MKRVKVFAFWAAAAAFAAAAVSAAAAGPGPQRRESQAERGRAVYADRCVRCHGADGRGQTRMGQDVGAPDMSDPAWQKARGDARMIASVADGRGQMPAFKKRLSRQDIAASVVYVRTLRR
ncbi:MAG TPA: c-type cytochrome [Pyrinomonadaceae bacterium]|jgi:cytochrome c oxidase cbb3-type subunit 3